MNNSDEKRLLVKRNKGKFGMYYLTALSPRDLSEISEESFDLPFLYPKESTRSNSCGGLLFFFDHTGHSYLCNPTTKQIQIFPPKEASRNPNYETKFAGACVGYDSKSDDYKILRIWDRDYWPSGAFYRERSFELYSLRDDSWEEIPSPASTCSSGIDKFIYARGKCYWLSRPTSRVVCFDCSKKSFSYLPLPRKLKSAHRCFELVKFNDEDLLGIAFCGRRGANPEAPLALWSSEVGFSFEVWVWSEGLSFWDTMFNVSLGGAVSGAETIYGSFLFLHGMAGGPTHYDCLDRLAVYDWTKKECKELGIYNFKFAIDVFCYVESTIALPHGKPINGSLVLNYGYFHHAYEKNERKSICTSPHDSFNEANKAYLDDFAYQSCDEAREAEFDDFAVNGFRVVNDIELEEEVVTHGNMPYAYYPASSIASGSNSVASSGSNSVASHAAPVAQIRGHQGMDNDLHGKALAVSCQLKTGSTKRARNPDAQGNIIISGDVYNRVDFPLRYANAKFFVIKSDSEDDVHKSIKYKMWSCTPYGNKKLNAAYEDAKRVRVAARDSRGCPIFLFFSVNASGQFCGIAEMTGPVDFHRDTDFWLRDKRSGYFPVKWHIIKDLSNSNFRHKILQNMPVTDRRDIQRISFRKGLEMLGIFKCHTSKTSLLDVFMSYEHKQRKICRKRVVGQRCMPGNSVKKRQR